MKTKLQEPSELLLKKTWYIDYRYTKNTKSQKYDKETFENPLHKRHIMMHKNEAVIMLVVGLF